MIYTDYELRLKNIAAVAKQSGLRYTGHDTEIVDVVGDNYLRIRVDDEKHVRLTTDISTEMLLKILTLFREKDNNDKTKVL